MRATFITTPLENGAQLEDVQKAAGHRKAHADGTPRVRYRRPADQRSRPQRWRDAVAELVELQAEYRD
jgi:hypothetical protein